VELTFYNQSGEAFDIAADEWKFLCEAAVSSGWRPAGTLKPPITFDIDRIGTAAKAPWSREYLVPRGQIVKRTDARNLGAALRCLQNPSAAALPLAEYCERGAFLVCEAPELGVAPQLVRMNAALLDKTSTDKPSRPVRTETAAPVSH
jgi:hypothetical protein